MGPFIETYSSLAAIFAVVRKAYTKKVYVDREFQRKTEQLVRESVYTSGIGEVGSLFEINGESIKQISEDQSGQRHQGHQSDRHSRKRRKKKAKIPI